MKILEQFPNYKLFCLCLYIYLRCIPAQTQTNLEQHLPFFEKQLNAYKQWMDSQEFNSIFTVEDVRIKNEYLEVNMQSSFIADDSLKYFWENHREMFYRKHNDRLEELIFDYCSFLMQISPDSLRLNIFGVDSSQPLIIIRHEQYVVWEGHFPASMEGGTINIPLKDLSIKPTSQNILTNSNETVNALTSRLKIFFYDYYSSKGTVFYKALLDTTDTYSQSFTFRVSCLNKEVITDGYFEYLEIKIEVQKIEDNIIVVYDVFAAYASGIRCPKFREVFYSPIGENNYPGKLRKYSDRLKQRIENLIKAK